MASIHETAENLHAAGTIMCQFDDACLTPVRPLSGREIRALREGASQAVFALSLKLLALVERGGLTAVA